MKGIDAQAKYIVFWIKECIIVVTRLPIWKKCCSECGAESAPAGQRLPAAGGDQAWAARTGSGPMRMCGDLLLVTKRITCDQDSMDEEDETSSIQSAFVGLCDELGSEVVAKWSWKTLRGIHERRLNKGEGDLDEWKKEDAGMVRSLA